jgi:hypothetical protein
MKEKNIEGVWKKGKKQKKGSGDEKNKKISPIRWQSIGHH